MAFKGESWPLSAWNLRLGRWRRGLVVGWGLEMDCAPSVMLDADRRRGAQVPAGKQVPAGYLIYL